MTIETIQLDWRGLRCPEPILKTARQVRKLRDGQDHRIQIYADDDAFPMDIKSWCSSSGVTLMAIEERDGYYEAILQLQPDASAEKKAAASAPAIPTPQAPPAAMVTPVLPKVSVQQLDCVGMACPEPILKLARAYRKLDDGQELQITADDDAFPVDIQSWLKSSGATLVSMQDTGSPFVATIKKPGAAQPVTAPASAPPTPAQPVVAQATPAPVQQVIAAPQQVGTSTLKLSLAGLSWEDSEARLTSMTGPAWTGETLDVLCADAAKLQKVVSWLGANGHELVHFDAAQGLLTLRVGAQTSTSTALVPTTKKDTDVKRATYLVIHNDFESLMAALMVANTSAVQNIETSIFFSFWGVNLLRSDNIRTNEPQKPLSFIHRMFRMMMPSGPSKQPLSKMHFGGMGKQMMLASMKQQNVMSLERLMEAAIENGVKFTVCTMSMGIMGIQKRDIMDRPNIEFAGVASFVADSASSDVSMVF